nr:proton-dependent oligopeptide transporter family [Tanacetum cinerariifolium]
MTQLTSICEMACQLVQKNLEEKQLEEEQTAKTQTWKLPVCYDDDDDEEGYNSLNDNIISELLSYSAVTPTEPIDSLSMADKHLDAILATESDEFINDDQSLSDEDFPKKIYSNPLFDEEIIPMEIDKHSFNAESDLIEFMPNHDSSIIISSKIDSLFDEFAGELTLLKSIPSGINETDCHPKKEIRFAKRLLYDNSSPRPPEEMVFDNSYADIESFSPSPIPNKDSDSHMEEIDLSINPDDPMPSGIEDADYDSERDIPILKELLDNYSLSLPANESYHFDIPSPYRPPAKPPDGITGTLNIKMMGDVSDQKGFEAFHPSAECPMIINGKNTPVLDVPLFLDKALLSPDGSVCSSSEVEEAKSTYTKIPSGITMLQRIGTGIFLSIVLMVVAALVETKRLKTAHEHGLIDDPNATVPMKIWWLLPQYLLAGAAEVFTVVGMQEFFYDQVPIELRSIGLALDLSVMGIGNFLSSFLISIVEKTTGGNGEDGWISDNVNRGHIDYFYHLLAAISAGAFVIYIYAAKSYVYNRVKAL